MATPPVTLDELRRRIDRVDDRLHDLILERAELVEAVAALKKSSGAPAMRAGREAAILRRLVARHRGRFPRQSLVRLWREILGGAVAMQGKFAVAVAATPDTPGLWDLARDHFGSHLAMIPLHATREVLSAVGEGRAAVGVLPVPSEDESEHWWPALADAGPSGPRVVARLPFAGSGNGRHENGDAFVIGFGEPDPSGADSTLLVVETEGQISRAKLLAALKETGCEAHFLSAVAPVPGRALSLVELDDLILPGDPRLEAALASLGGKAKGARLFGVYPRALEAA